MTELVASPKVEPAVLDFAARLIRLAHRDADRLIVFFDKIGLQRHLWARNPGAEAPEPPAGEGAMDAARQWLQDVAFALRIADWEARGITSHIAAGLPDSKTAMARAFELQGFPRFSPEERFGARVQLFDARYLARDGGVLIDAEVELGVPDEDALIDSMAEFLLSRARQRGANLGETSP